MEAQAVQIPQLIPGRASNISQAPIADTLRAAAHTMRVSLVPGRSSVAVNLFSGSIIDEKI
jgi:hypothetical protein